MTDLAKPLETSGLHTRAPEKSWGRAVDVERLDVSLVRRGWVRSRRQAKELIDSGKVTVNGHLLHKGETVTTDDDIRVLQPFATATLSPNPELKIEVLFEDRSVLVVNKPGLMACHPLRATESGTVINAIVAAYPEVATAGDRLLEGGLVHRLDNGTSGGLIIARTQRAFEMMRAAIRRGQIERQYLALCAGHFDDAREIATPIAHHPKSRRKMITVPASSNFAGCRPAATLVEPLHHCGDFTLVQVTPRTGSRHQIRVHLASIGHPIAGDVLYGGPNCELPSGRFWLHLAQIALDSPSTLNVRVKAPLAAELDNLLTRLIL